MDYIISPSSDKDLENVKVFLKGLNLPLEGLEHQFDNFFLIKQENTIIGTVGLEIYENSGLLRSLAVHPDFRNRHLAKKLVNEVLQLAKKNNLHTIYLLTETANHFFRKLEFQEINRELASDAIKNSIEFSQACPDSASLMKKSLI